MADTTFSEPTGLACPGCLSLANHEFGKKTGYEYRHCCRCGTIWTPPPAHQDVFDELYNHYYDHAQFSISPAARHSLEKLVRSFGEYRETGRLLDLGYGEGALLRIAAGNGWKCHGSEISPTALNYGKENGWTVGVDTEYEDNFPSNGFDVVTMLELIEHVGAPDNLLQTAVRCLRPGGLLYITTPNAGSINNRILGIKWTIFSPPEHLTVWTASGLRYALSRCGLKCCSIRTEGLNPSEILTQLRPGSAGATSRNTTAFALNEKFSRNAWRREVKRAINTGLSFVGIGDTLKVRAEVPSQLKHLASGGTA